MKLTADSVISTKSFLFLGNTTSIIARNLLAYALKHEIPAETNNLARVSSVTNLFIIDPTLHDLDMSLIKEQKIHLIFTNSSKQSQNKGHLLQKKYKNSQLIFIDSDADDDRITQKIIWLVLESSTEPMFIRTFKDSLAPVGEKKPRKHFKLKIRHILALFVLSQMLFMLPLSISSILLGRTEKFIRLGDFNNAKKINKFTEKTSSATRVFYSISRPLLSFLYVSPVIENIIASVDIATKSIDQSLAIVENTNQLLAMITKPDSSSEEITLRLNILKKQAGSLEQAMLLLSGKLSQIPFIDKQNIQKLSSYSKTLSQLRDFVNVAPVFLAKNSQKKYLIFFYNNMEIRPGGGFIGSYAILNVKDYHIGDIEVYDIYDLDGQLKGHIEPPTAIKTHLNQPHWFTRDSNFSPDFEVNVKVAESFMNRILQKENKFDGYIGITTSALSNILNAFPSVYLPDYDEYLTSENFFLKTQSEIEIDKFEGSKKKKNYIGTLAKTLLLSIDKASILRLGEGLTKSLQEKHIVFKSNDPNVDNFFKKSGWGGSMAVYKCLDNKKCVVNYIMPVDANLGVNKANYYLSRHIQVKSKIKSKNLLTTEVITIFNNQSPSDSFPGGTYKNYFQLYIPVESSNIKVYINGSITDSFSVLADKHFNMIAVFLTVPPRNSLSIKVGYSMQIPEDVQNYQLVVQKQIGSINNEIGLVFENNESSFNMIPKNFDYIEKNGQLRYNTSLLSDKVFVIKLN